MSLQYILGNAGSGKSYFGYDLLIRQAMEHPERRYYVIVPEQFSMQTQKTVVEMHPRGGILNIDILSFQRLAYRVFEETGTDSRRLLEDIGKSMILMKLAQVHEKEMPYLGRQLKKPGFLDEVKSLFSEFMQYDISTQSLKEALEKAQEKPLLSMKLKDMTVLYEAFRAYIGEHYTTSEEVMDILVKLLPFSEKVRDSVFLFDGFTGFTPIQIRVIEQLLKMTRKVYVTVTMEVVRDGERIFAKRQLTHQPHQLFYMSGQMMRSLEKLTEYLDPEILIEPGEKSRFSVNGALAHLEKNLFRYETTVYQGASDEIEIFAAATPLKEAWEVARRMMRLVREEGLKYGDIAVITGNLEDYASFLRQAFDDSRIPYFVDEKHAVMQNPFVEWIRALLEMVLQDFSYESVFRYLRCGMSDLKRSEIDLLENYVLAYGIRGYGKWNEKWIRVRKKEAELYTQVNEIREKFIGPLGDFRKVFAVRENTVEAYCLGLYDMICENRMAEKLRMQKEIFARQGDKALEKEYEQIYPLIMDLLDRMVDILGNEQVTREQFRQLLETGMSKVKVALIPPSLDQVLIGDMERTRLKDIKVLFFVGVNEGNIPKTPGGGGMLSDTDRDFLKEQKLELAPGPKEQMGHQHFYLYQNLTKPSKKLCLSFSRSTSKGQALTPAFLIEKIYRLFPEMKIGYAEQQSGTDTVQTPGSGISCFLDGLHAFALSDETDPDPFFAELYSWYKRDPEYALMADRMLDAAFLTRPQDPISQAAAKAVYGEIPAVGATRMEQYARCAYAHFLQLGLRLQERREYVFENRDLGNLVHESLEAFSKRLAKEKIDWRELGEEKRIETIDACLEQVLLDKEGEKSILYDSARNTYIIERTRRILHRTVWALEEHLKNGSFHPAGIEVRLGGGRLDRMDLCADGDRLYVKILDYKTGNTKFDLIELYYGLQLQLLFYMDEACRQLEERTENRDKEIIPAGVFYYHVSEPMITGSGEESEEEIREAILKELKLSGLVLEEEAVVDLLDRTLASLPVSRTKTGFSKLSRFATEEQFRTLMKYVHRKIRRFSDEIMDGQVQENPFEMGSRNACTYCNVAGACPFDRKIPGYMFRKLAKLEKEEIFRRMENEIRQGEAEAEEVWEDAVDDGTETGH